VLYCTNAEKYFKIKGSFAVSDLTVSWSNLVIWFTAHLTWMLHDRKQNLCLWWCFRISQKKV